MSEREPALRPTEPATLVVAALAAAAVAWLLISNIYSSMPPLGWPPVIIIAGLAALEVVAAQNTWARVQQRGRASVRQPGTPQREPLEPLAVARLAALAKASSLGGAIFLGFFAGLLPWLLVEAGRLADAAADLPPAIGGVVASGGLLAAAIWLERACRVPDRPEDEDQAASDDAT